MCFQKIRRFGVLIPNQSRIKEIKGHFGEEKAQLFVVLPVAAWSNQT